MPIGDGSRLKPFKYRRSPFDPFSGEFFPLDHFAKSDIRPFLFKTQYDDYLKCYALGREDKYGDTDEDTENWERIVYVAKPYILRRSPFDNKTVDSVSYVYTNAYTRTASKAGETDETQLITPSYVENEIILAVRIETNIITDDSEDAKPVDWMDLGIGRAWAVEV